MKKINKTFQWNKVTPLSKYLAMALFITLPFIGFMLGMKYQQKIKIMENQNSQFQSIESQANLKNIRPSSTPKEAIGNSLSKKYISPSGKVSFNYYPGWNVNSINDSDYGLITTVIGPKQLLRIIEGADIDHGFDDFLITKTQVTIAGKKFDAEKYTSQSWNNSFISAKIQEIPYKLYVEYGDAASVGFKGFDQLDDEKVNFEKDIQPINKLLQTLSWK